MDSRPQYRLLHHTGLGSGEEACQNAAHDNDDGQQRGHCINDDLDGGVGVLDGGGLIALLDGDEHSQNSHAQTHQDAGGGRADVDGCGVVGVVALIQLQRSHDGAHGRGSCHGGTGNGTEEHISQNVGGSQIAGHLAHSQTCQTDKALCNAALVHDVAAQREEGQRQQREGVNAREAALCGGQGKNCGIHAEQCREDGCNADACRDGHTGQQHDKEGTEQQ